MNKQILITGGAGFVGSHLADELLKHDYRVRALDNLSPQVHGDNSARPDYLNPEVEFLRGDVRDAEAVRRALENVDGVFHLAAMVGVGQSMYEIAKYTDVNNMGAAVLMEALIKKPVEKLVVASSMSLYGEGLYQAPDGALVPGTERPLSQLKTHDWEVRDAHGDMLKPLPTPETKPPALASIYALSKFDQERMCLLIGRAYGISTVALRFFNIFGTRQALSNPYTGVLAIFGARFLNDAPPLVNEDGHQRRDFVSVYDVSRACRLAFEAPEEKLAATQRVFNIGSGQAVSVLEVAQRMARALNKAHIEAQVTGKYRVGDIRHCFADIELARQTLGFEPQVSLEDGLIELAQWLPGQVAVDHVGQAGQELAARGLSL